jgi:hypothetical protein
MHSLMDQVYWVGKPNDDGRRPVLYRYGNFCYTDLIRVDNCDDIRKLPSVMQFLQSIQVSFVCMFAWCLRRFGGVQPRNFAVKRQWFPKPNSPSIEFGAISRPLHVAFTLALT